MKNKKIPKIIVVVVGGVVQDIIADSSVRVCLKDIDSIEVGERFNDRFDYPVVVVDNQKELENHLWKDTINE